MFQRFQSIVTAALVFVMSGDAALAQASWIKIGSQTIDTAAQVASIPLDGLSGGRAVRLEARQGNVVMRAVVVTFGQGRVHVEERPIVLNQGERTRPIELSVKDEIVRSIEIVLAPGGRGKVTLEAWALTTPVTTSAAPPGSEQWGYSGKPVGKAGEGPPRAPSSTPSDPTGGSAPYQGPQAAEDRRKLEDAARRAAEQKAKSEAERKQPSVVIPRGITIGRDIIGGTRKRSVGGGHVSGVPVDRTVARPKSDEQPKDVVRPVSYSYSLETLDACVKAKTCTPVPIFFGTDRNQTTAKGGRISFGTARAGRVQLGRVFVTVPSKNRTHGELNLPGTVDWLTGTPEGGDPSRHFTIPKTGITLYQSEAELIAAVREHVASGLGTHKDHAFVYVHGYRTPWEFAAMRTAQIAYDLSPDDAPFGTPFLYSWPSQGAAADYITDLDNSRIAIPHLISFLRMVVEKTGASQVHVIAHSMGNFPVMHALAEIAKSAPHVKFSQVILAAPDVEKQEFEDVAKGVIKVAKSVTLYASSSDIALLLSRLVRRDKPRAGDAKDPPGPAVVAGMDTVDISRLSTGFMSYFSWNHDRYADSPVLLNDISTLFRDGHRAPNLRNLSFRMYEARFWRYQD